MDFVDWCGRVLKGIDQGTQGAVPQRTMGASSLEVADAIFGEGTYSQPGFGESDRRAAIEEAFESLLAARLVDRGMGRGYKLTDLGRDACEEPTKIWEAYCSSPERLGAEQQQLLHVINSLSQKPGDAYATVQWVNQDEFLPLLEWPEGRALANPVAKELDERRLIRWRPTAGALRLKATYWGLVWETRRAFAGESREIDRLIAEGETTSVDFKREIHARTADEKAELTKDLIALANTKASGPHLLVIGFEPKKLEYYGPPDPKLSQDDLERIVNAYTDPAVTFRYTRVPYRAGEVGKIEVIRERAKLPYKVRKSIGDTRRVTEGQVFVRHGSQVEQPSEAEMAALIEEGERARSAEP